MEANIGEENPAALLAQQEAQPEGSKLPFAAE